MKYVFIVLGIAIFICLVYLLINLLDMAKVLKENMDEIDSLKKHSDSLNEAKETINKNLKPKLKTAGTALLLYLTYKHLKKDWNNKSRKAFIKSYIKEASRAIN